MSKIIVNDQVKIVVPSASPYSIFDGLEGTVERIYPSESGGLAIVALTDSAAKIPVRYLVKTQENESKNDLPEGAKRITRADFEAALGVILSSENVIDAENFMGRLVAALTARIVGGRICDRLFEIEDEVVLTEEDFIAVIWDGCSPINACESVHKKMLVRDCIDVSVSALIFLRKLVTILFDESEND